MKKRKRGVMLTAEGIKVLQSARRTLELESGEKLTLEAVSELAGLNVTTVKKVLSGRKRVDKQTVEILFRAFNIDCCSIYFSSRVRRIRDVKGMPVVALFVGRSQELKLTQEWITTEHIRVLSICGIGGVGKTGLATKIVDSVESQYDFVFWKTLRNTVTANALVDELVDFFLEGEAKDTTSSELYSEKILRLIDCFRKFRCLVVLDNLDAVFRDSHLAGKYIDGCEPFSELLVKVAELQHQSCLLITTREKPREISFIDGENLPTKTLELQGLNEDEGEELLNTKDIRGTEAECKQLIKPYWGNILAIKMAMTTVREIFNGDVSAFLEGGASIFGEIRTFIERQYSRVSDKEKEIMLWLSINREPVTIATLCQDLLPPSPNRGLIESVESLSRRCFIRKEDGLFSLNPIIDEYIISKIVEGVSGELVDQYFVIVRNHALLKTTCEDHVKEEQKYIFIEPIVENLIVSFHSEEGARHHLKLLIQKCQNNNLLQPDYAVGNIINCLICLGADLSGYDLSKLSLKQVDLQQVCLHGTNFTNATFERCSFAHAFGSVYSVAFNSTDQLLAAGDGNGVIHIYDVATGKLVLKCTGHLGWVTSVAFSPDGRFIASGGADHEVRLWDTGTGKCLKVYTYHESEVWSVAFSPDNTLLASGSDDHSIVLWNIELEKKEKVLMGHTSWVLSVAFPPWESKPLSGGKVLSAQPDSLFSAGDDGSIKVWDVKSGLCKRTFRPDNQPKSPFNSDGIRSIAVSPCGQVIASGGEDQKILVWDVDEGKCIQTFDGHRNRVFSVAFSSCGNYIASGAHDHTVMVWDLNDGGKSKTLEGHYSWVFSVAFGSCSQMLASGGYGQLIKIWNPETGKCLKTIQGYTNQVLCVDVSSDGQIIASGGRDQTVKIWNASTGNLIRNCIGHTNHVYAVLFSHDGNIVASSSGDATIKLWDVQTGCLIHTLKSHNLTVLSLAFSQDMKMLISGSEDHTVKVWDVSSGRLLKTLSGHNGAIWSTAFTKQPGIIASGSWDKTIRIWDLQLGECLNIIEGHSSWIWAIAISSDGQWIASSSPDQTIRVSEISTGECRAVIKTDTTWLRSIRFILEDRVIAASSHQHTIQMWEIDSGDLVDELHAHAGSIWSMAVTPDGSTLVSGGGDETINVWDIRAKECLKTMRTLKPYENMNIIGVSGLTDATLDNLMVLGAIKSPSSQLNPA